MKKTLATVGLAALSATTMHAQMATDLTPTEKAKFWSISSTLRGFYDDNVTTLPRSISPFVAPGVTINPSTAKGSFGIEVSPSITFNHSSENTSLSGGFTYDLKKYIDSLHFSDQTFQFKTKLDHAFSERYKLTVSESFVIAQEPTVIDPTITSSPLRISGSNKRNLASIGFTAELTKLLAFEMDYANTFYAYDQHVSAFGTPQFVQPSRSAQLDRMEHLLSLNLLWHAAENTTARLGYNFGVNDYTSPETIIYAVPGAPGTPNITSNIRNNYTHTVYLGVDHNFTPELNAMARVGVEDVDYYHAINPHNNISPYADASVTWRYQRGSYAQAGLKHQHNSTDITGGSLANLVTDQESTSVYLSGSHQIIPPFSVGWLGQYQHSVFQGGGTRSATNPGGLNGSVDDFFVARLNLTYQFNPFIAAETGYEYNHLGSDIGNRSYTRNQIYIGIRASY